MPDGKIRLGWAHWAKVGTEVSQQERRQLTAHLRNTQPPHTRRAGIAGGRRVTWGLRGQRAVKSLEQPDTFVYDCGLQGVPGQLEYQQGSSQGS